MSTQEKITVRPAEERGKTELGWLHSAHTFSFGEYYDPRHMGYHSLRVINDDLVAPGAGFPLHPHRDMEIISIVLEGAIAHADSLGHQEELRPGEVQVMSAGTGIRHSEFNPSDTERLRLLQIWIEPHTKGLRPTYQQKAFPVTEYTNRLVRVVGREGSADDGAIPIHQAADLSLLRIDTYQKVEHSISEGTAVWVQMATGEALVNGVVVRAGDGVSLEQIDTLAVKGIAAQSQLLIFELNQR